MEDSFSQTYPQPLTRTKRAHPRLTVTHTQIEGRTPLTLTSQYSYVTVSILARYWCHAGSLIALIHSHTWHNRFIWPQVVADPDTVGDRIRDRTMRPGAPPDTVRLLAARPPWAPGSDAQDRAPENGCR